MSETLYQQLRQVSRQGSHFNNGWRELNARSIRDIPEKWHHWLNHDGSLTSKLVNFSDQKFEVNVLSEHWARPSRYAAAKLKLDHQLAVRVREVELLCDDQVMVFARTIIPLQLHQQNQALFSRMGSRPLGHFLFREGDMNVSQRDIRTHVVNNNTKIYARATPYSFRGSRVLVCEHFVNQALVAD